MSSRRPVSSAPRVPSADSIRRATHPPGSVKQALPPFPLELLAHGVQALADYPYDQTRLNPWTDPVAHLARFLASGMPELIQDEAESQDLLI